MSSEPPLSPFFNICDDIYSKSNYIMSSKYFGNKNDNRKNNGKNASNKMKNNMNKKKGGSGIKKSGRGK